MMSGSNSRVFLRTERYLALSSSRSMTMKARVVDAVHAEGADEVAFHEPEGFGEQQRAGDFGGDAIDDFAPELVGHAAVEFRLAHAVLGARRDGAAGAGAGKPEAMEVALGQGHGRVEADDRETGARREGWSG